MPTRLPSVRARWSLLACLLAAACAPPPAAAPVPQSPGPAAAGARPVLPLQLAGGLGADTLVTRNPAWDEVRRLADDQKYQAALERVGVILARARTEKNEADWVRGLIETVQLR